MLTLFNFSRPCSSFSSSQARPNYVRCHGSLIPYAKQSHCTRGRILSTMRFTLSLCCQQTTATRNFTWLVLPCSPPTYTRKATPLIKEQKFQQGRRKITAYLAPCTHHPNILHLKSQRNFLGWLLSFLPQVCRNLFASRYPGWCLPPKVVMKREKAG